MSAPRMVRIPTTFLDDHRGRDLPTPKVVRRTRRHAWIDPQDPAVPELLSDARFYMEEGMYMDPPRPGLVSSARATIHALTQEG